MRTLLLACLLLPVIAADLELVPGTIRTSWVGNDFPGAGDNGRGLWVQNSISCLAVSPEGTAIAGAIYDEAGRCIGLYRDGQPNHELLKQYNGAGGHSAWGWGTATRAVAVDGDRIYAVNTKGDLLVFAWTPGDLESARYLTQHRVGSAQALAAQGGELVVALSSGELVRLGEEGAQELARHAAPGAQSLALVDDRLWVLAEGRITLHQRASLEPTPTVLTTVEHPTAIGVDHRGRLLVCDDGERQQVLVFDLGRQPHDPLREVEAWGVRGGARAIGGAFRSDHFHGLRGAGTDAAGNRYVALGYQARPCGRAELRSFSPDGTLRWQVASRAFVDSYGFLPGSDGTQVYGAMEVFHLDPAVTTPGGEARMVAHTVDHVTHRDDPRIGGERLKNGRAVTARPRQLHDRLVVFGFGQYSGGVSLWVADGEGSFLRPAGKLLGKGWGWEVDLAGAVWQADPESRTIRRHVCTGFTTSGDPMFAVADADVWPYPEDYKVIERVWYDVASDALLICGVADGQRSASWGLIGPVATRYDGWTRGERNQRWRITMPVDGENLQPKSWCVAGDVLFTVMVKPTRGRSALVTAFDLATGARLGHLWPGAEVGGQSGWVDMSHAIDAVQRSDGEYWILVEEDFRAKNLLYRWTPAMADR